jgi:hypothetical protein
LEAWYLGLAKEYGVLIDSYKSVGKTTKLSNIRSLMMTFCMIYKVVMLIGSIANFSVGQYLDKLFENGLKVDAFDIAQKQKSSVVILN